MFSNHFDQGNAFCALTPNNQMKANSLHRLPFVARQNPNSLSSVPHPAMKTSAVLTCRHDHARNQVDIPFQNTGTEIFSKNGIIPVYEEDRTIDGDDDDSLSEASTPKYSAYSAGPLGFTMSPMVTYTIISCSNATGTNERGARRVRFLSFVSIRTFDEHEAHQESRNKNYHTCIEPPLPKSSKPSVAVRIARTLSRGFPCMTLSK